tara:strand:+ start:2117 stop:2332 length:216 start_codon:yes stop_codon:yes gene_type:complete
MLNPQFNYLKSYLFTWTITFNVYLLYHESIFSKSKSKLAIAKNIVIAETVTHRGIAKFADIEGRISTVDDA